MKLVTVTPIKRGIAMEVLSYFTPLPVSPGALVAVPLRKKSIPAIVLSVEGVNETKSAIKAQGFEMRKVERVIAEHFFTDSFMRAVAEAAKYFASTTGAVLASIVPTTFFEEELLMPPGTEKKRTMLPREKNIIQTGPDERMSAYKKIIREEFAAGRSVFCLAPTIEEARWLHDSLCKGIEGYAYLLYGSLRKKALAESWRKALAETHPVLIVGTGSFMSLPRHDFGTYIVEQENSRSYKLQSRPYLDLRTFAEMLAKASGARLILGDTLLRTETLWREEEGDLIPLEPLIFRLLTGATSDLVDLRKKKGEEDAPFEIISQKLKELAVSAFENHDHLFIYASRRGYAPITLCRDCGVPVTCKNCQAPVILHLAETEGIDNQFICHRCGTKRSAREVCKNCSSWRLSEYGVGIERIAQEIRKLIPEAPIFILDKDSVATEKQARDTVAEFAAASGAILIGTELAIHYLPPVDAAAVVSIDHLFSLPDFRIHEKIFTLILTIRGLAQHAFLIETRRPEEKLFQSALSGDLSAFYRSDLAERRRYGYPPFAVLIKISVTADEKRARAEIERVEKMLSSEETYSFPAFIPNARGKFTMHLLLKLPQGRWPDAELDQKLHSLPPYFSIRVDPENLL